MAVPLASQQKLSMQVVGCFVGQPPVSTLGRHICHQQYKSKGTHQKVGYANSPPEDTKLSNALDSTQALVTQT
jgi:hypothetical protein